MNDMQLVLVAAPLIDRDANLVSSWSANIDAIAVEYPKFHFIKCMAIREKDNIAQQSCEAANIDILTVPWYSILPDKRHNYEGVMAKRTRLMQEAVARHVDIIWYVDADILVQSKHWSAISSLFTKNYPVVVIPYAIRWANGKPSICLNSSSSSLELSIHDSRSFSSVDESQSIVGGGFGCTALIVNVVANIPFNVQELALSSGGYVRGEDIGWFLNAYHAGIKIQMPLRITVKHIGCDEN
jgi:hypothetical protein